MSIPVITTPAALEQAVTATAASLATALDTTQIPGKALYLLTSTTNAWVAQGIADTVFTAATTDILSTSTANALITGMPVTVSNSGGGLPAGLSAATVYWAYVISPTTFYLYDTRAHALLGGATGRVDITTTGTGTQTATTTATAAAGSAFVAASVPYYVDGWLGAKISILRDTADGKASLMPVVVPR